MKTLDILRGVVSHPTPGQGGINAADMRSRCRILDILDKADGDSLLMEDADHAVMSRLMSSYQFNIAHPLLLQIIDDVVEAKEPEQAKAA
jgi:hypothetical protein